MNSSLDAYLGAIAPYLHADLISPEAFGRIRDLAGDLAPGSRKGFECRLGRDRSRVDFHIWPSRYHPTFPDRFLKFPEWNAIVDFYRQWNNPGSFLSSTIDCLGLEFDLPEETENPPVPGVLIALNPSVTRDATRLIELLDRTIFPLFHLSPPPELPSRLHSCIECLPGGASMTHVAWMLSRRERELRGVVRGMTAPALLDYLARLRWTGSIERLSATLADLMGMGYTIALSYDIGDMISPRIGLECHLPESRESDRQWTLLLDYLVERQLCDRAKRDALLAWSGISLREDTPELWPLNVTLGDRFFGSEADSVFWRTIYEIKIVFQEQEILEAKAYLAFGHSWLSRDQITIGGGRK